MSVAGCCRFLLIPSSNSQLVSGLSDGSYQATNLNDGGSIRPFPHSFGGDRRILSARKVRPTLMENDRITVLQAIAMAHGINNTAKVGASKLIRTTPDGPQEVPIHLKKILSAQAPDMPLQPGDVLFIPNSRAKEVGRRSLDVILSAAATAMIYRP